MMLGFDEVTIDLCLDTLFGVKNGLSQVDWVIVVIMQSETGFDDQMREMGHVASYVIYNQSSGTAAAVPDS
jgi:hypothetical protein